MALRLALAVMVSTDGTLASAAVIKQRVEELTRLEIGSRFIECCLGPIKRSIWALDERLMGWCSSSGRSTWTLPWPGSRWRCERSVEGSGMICLASFDSIVGYGLNYWNQGKNAKKGFWASCSKPFVLL
jgi:hypothetical protein